jgi:hypothetical protein
MQVDDVLALGLVLAAAAWLVRYFVRRIQSVTRSQETPSSKLVQITFPDKDEHQD